MNDDSNSGNRDGRKPEDAPKSDRYAWHTCWHDDAWRGIELMTPEVVGVYWRIILLMYRQRSAIIDDDKKMAMACFTSVKQYRRAKTELIEKRRLEVDEERGLIYCPRAVRQLVKDQRYRESQGKKGKRGGRPRLVVDNEPVLQMRDDDRVGVDFDPKLGGGNSVSNSAPIGENQTLTKSRAKATQTHTQNIATTSAESPPSAPAPAATLPLRGSGGGDRKKARQEALAALSRSSLAQPKGSDETVPEPTRQPDPEKPKPAADRTARRA